jgi:hypothetical protein
MKRIRYIAALAVAVGLAGVALTIAAGPVKLTDTEFNQLAPAAKTAQDHLKLAAHYRVLAADHEAEAKVYDALVTEYKKGVAGATQGHAAELARTVRHYAGHARDSAEALLDLAAVHEGIAENMQGGIK